VVRNPARWAATGLPGTPRVADLADPAALQEALGDADAVVSCAHARHAAAILTAAPRARKFVFLGSTRKFTCWPDAHGSGVLAGEAAFLASGRPGVMLHPTMIYGAQGDVTDALLAAWRSEWPNPQTRIIAGPEPCTYADFVRAVAEAAGLPLPRIVPVPLWLLLAATPLTRLPGVPRLGTDEIRRLAEDKAFVSDFSSITGRPGTALREGLARQRLLDRKSLATPSVANAL
jgi:uncharacterized protein YbjT (DUF2867 family)